MALLCSERLYREHADRKAKHVLGYMGYMGYMGYGWLWMAMDGYGWLWMAMDGFGSPFDIPCAVPIFT